MIIVVVCKEYIFKFCDCTKKKNRKRKSLEDPLESARWGRHWSIEKSFAGGWQRVKLKVNGEREL
jgi:hypothetical protein